MVTSTKIYMLSCAAISKLVKDFPATPSTFKRKKELVPRASFKEEITSLPLLRLCNLNSLVVEPMRVNTVSNKIESCEKLSLADGLVICLSFLQDIKKLRTRASADM